MPHLASAQTCTGCSACFNICPKKAISMIPNTKGFLMPNVDGNKCVECKLCEKVCPIINGKNLKNPETEKVYAFWDNKTRTQSSSGGAFSAIARWIFDRDGIVFGAAWINGFECGHIACNSMNELHRLRGSKYVQSDIRKTYVEARNILTEGQYVLFSGTPCQIGGLKSYLGKTFEKLITVEIVCHGVPSNYLFNNYIKKLKKENKSFKNASSFEFRRLNNWGFSPTLILSNHRQKLLTGVENLYMKAFEKAAIFRESCYDCRFNGLKRVSDITIADFWGIGKQDIPFHHDVSQGVSLVMANTLLGKEIINNLKDCFIEERPMKEATNSNHNILSSSLRHPLRDSIIDSFNSPKTTLAEINGKYQLIGSGIVSKLLTLLVKLHLFWPIKSIINKIRSL